MWQPHNREQRSVSRPVSQGWGSVSWPRARHERLKYPGRRAWKQHSQTQDTRAGIRIMGREDDACNSLLFHEHPLGWKFLQPVFVGPNRSTNANVEVSAWCIMSCKSFAAKLVISARCDFQRRQCSFYFLTCNHKMDCPLWSWHSLTQRKKEKWWGRKGLWWKDWTQPPAHTLSLPPSLPCPVELIWQRGGSISQFTQAAAAFFFSFLCRAFSFGSPCLRLHPHPPLCSLCARSCLPRVCALQCLRSSACIGVVE